jgi:hypothetical protein
MVPAYAARMAEEVRIGDKTMTFLTAARQQMTLPLIAFLGRKQIAIQPVIQLRPKMMNSPPAPSRLRRQVFEMLVFGLVPSVLALLVVPAILGGKNLPAQTLAPQATKPTQQQKAAEATPPPRPAAEAIDARPSASPTPILPANQPPNEAKVRWDSRGLEIEASNSSLDQILHQIAVDTGTQVEGLTEDQRVFGIYGPGPESDVLWKLLDGSGYNVLMIGGRDAAPLKIVLSARSPASPQMAVKNQNRINSDRLESAPRAAYPPDPPPPQPIQNPFGNGEPPRDPLQFMQEILQRQQQIDQQEQQQNQKNHPQ